MKKLYAIILFALVFFSADAQTNVYHPFPSDSTVWVYHTYTPQNNDYDEYIQLLGDTKINSIAYKKEFHRYSYSPPGWAFSGWIRQDIPNKKIYLLDYYGVEHDVSVSQYLIVGDTLPIFSNGFSFPYCPPLPYDTIKIISIDSVKIGTKFHKRYNCNFSVTYIVGVGMEGIFLSNPTQSIDLTCFSVDNVSQYGFATPCGLVSVNEFSINENSITIYPNPTSGVFTIKGIGQQQTANFQIEIYNVYGEKVKELSANSYQPIAIDLSLQPSGIYFLQLKTNEGIATKKLVISK